MNKRSGFTLMELLLVVAVLAIVAAAAAPTFFGGATEAMNEARRASYLSAYTNTLSGASMYVSIQASKGEDPESPITEATLNKYVPAAARTFKGGENGETDIVLGAQMSGDLVQVIAGGNVVAIATATWNTIKDYNSL